MKAAYLKLSSKEEKVLLNLSNLLLRQVQSHSDPNLQEVLTSLVDSLPYRLTSFLSDYKYSLSQSICIIDNLPFEKSESLESPETHRSFLGDQKITLADAMHSIICRFFGFLVGFSYQQWGRLVNDIIPIEKDSFLEGASTSANVSFHLHTEESFLMHPPRFLCFSCIRNEEKAETLISTPSISDLDFAIQEELSRSNFTIATNSLQKKELMSNEVLSIIFGFENELSLRFNMGRMYPIDKTSEALRAISKLEDLVNKEKKSLIFRRSCMYILNNHRIAHGRRNYPTDFGSKKRWLLRSVVTTDLDLYDRYLDSSRPFVINT